VDERGGERIVTNIEAPKEGKEKESAIACLIPSVEANAANVGRLMADWRTIDG
jgi:hypothetical protein